MKIKSYFIHNFIKNPRSIISVGLVIGLLFNATYNSFSGILSEDGRYETFISDNITIREILEDDKTDIKIEGNTLVNVIGDLSHVFHNGTIKGDSFSFVSNGSESRLYFKNSNIKENTTYTIFYNITKNTLNNFNENDKTVMKFNVNNYNYVDNGYIFINKGETGLFSKTITTKEANCMPYLETIPGSTYQVGGEFEIKDMMIIEGDWSNKTIPKYFKAIESSFENQLVTQEMIDSGQEEQDNLGKYKVEYKSIGNNIFDGKVINGEYNVNTGEYVLLNSITANVNPISVKENHKYFIFRPDLSQINNGRVFFYDSSMNYISNALLVGNTSFTTPANCRYINFHIDTKGYMPDLRVQISESETDIYESYRESINTFYLNSPLLEGDTIEYINGQAYHIKRYNKVVLDGSEDEIWNPSSSNVELGLKSYYINIENKKPYGKLFNNKFAVIGTDIWQDISAIGICNGKVALGVISDLLTLNEFKQELSQNPATIVYELENPIYEPIKTDLSVQLFEGNTYVLNNSNISTDMEIEVDRVLNRAVEAIELAKINPTIQNLSLARMWTNLAKETIKKDELQNEINNITKVEDLSIEKKTVTSNIDIYIKPENSLTMSLSINHITFEDYSSVSDLYMDNAIQITVSSSLPYRVNSYLQTEIQNSDGSNKIDKEFLYIKEDSDVEYKQFLGLNQKLTLKEDCEAGKNNIHDIDFKLKASSHDADIYEAVIKFEAEQK